MKNVFIIPMVLMTLASCGKKTETIVGSPGATGESCYAEVIDGDKTITCGDSFFTVSDGIDGINGQDGNDGSDGIDGQDGVDGVKGDDGADGSFTGYLDHVEVCPDIPGNYPEVLVFLDGKYMAFLSDGNYKKQRLVILGNGNYITTDGRNVNFSIQGEEIICPE